MTNIGPIAPALKLNGSLLAQDHIKSLVSVRVERGLNLVSRCALRFRDRGYAISATDKYALGAKIKVEVPGAGALFDGVITGISLEQPWGKVAEFVVIADDSAFKLARGTQVKTYLNVGYSEVLRQLAQRHGLTLTSDSLAGTFEYLLQTGSDLEFLNQIVERVGHSWWVDGDTTLNVKKVAMASPTATLTFGKELYEFSVRASGLRPTAVEVNGWNANQQQNVKGTNTPPTSNPPSLVTNYVGTGPSSKLTESKSTLTAPNPLTADEANAIATGLFDDYASAAVIARGTCEVSDAIEPGCTIAIADAGPASGNYLVTAVEHVFDRERFETRFTAGPRRPSSLVDTLGGGARVDSGFLSSGLVVGVITDNGDSEGRVKVRYTGVGGEIESPWARVATLGGGSARGIVFVPEVGDEVLVGFERGDTRRPVVIGGLFSEQNKLPTAGSGVKEGKVEYRRITSRKNHLIEIADGEGPAEQYVLIQLGTAQHKLRIGGDRFDIEIAQGKPMTIKAGSAMFDINAAGNISIEGKNVTIKADGNLLLQGGTKATLESNATTQVTGTQLQVKANATASVEASGPLALKGATVAIN